MALMVADGFLFLIGRKRPAVVGVVEIAIAVADDEGQCAVGA